MSILAVSVSHRTASLDVLAAVAMAEGDGRTLAKSLVSRDFIDEALVLSTCNRTEVYVEASVFHPALEAIIDAIGVHAGLSRSELHSTCAVYYSDAAVTHCFTLVPGLDSLVVGESQVLGQVRTALSLAQQSGTSGPVLNSLFQQALRVGKRVHSETTIGGAGRSVLSAALGQLAGYGIAPAGRACLVVGAGQMAGLAARTLASLGGDITCINRTFSRAQRLASEVEGVARPFAELADAVAQADLVVTCTGARLINLDTLGSRVPRAIIDLALPPDVEPAVGQRCVLVNLASIAQLHDDTDAEQARTLVDAEVAAFLTRQRADAVTPTVVALRSMATDIVDVELRRLCGKLPSLESEVVDEIARTLTRVADKFVHEPSVRVREFAGDDDVDYASVLRTLFALDAGLLADSTVDECDTTAAAAVKDPGRRSSPARPHDTAGAQSTQRVAEAG